jgi:hypothetical protein
MDLSGITQTGVKDGLKRIAGAVAALGLLLASSGCSQGPVEGEASGPRQPEVRLDEPEAVVKLSPAQSQTPLLKGSWLFEGCEEAIVKVPDEWSTTAEGLRCTWRGRDERGRESERAESFARDGARVEVSENTIQWDHIANDPGKIKPLRRPPPEAQTPWVPGEWRFVGCEVGLVWDAHQIDLWVSGHICTWDGFDPMGRKARRIERFAEGGARVGVTETLR